MGDDLFIGRHVDTGESVTYDGDDLTTTGSSWGMNGGGRDRAGVAILEGTLLNGIFAAEPGSWGAPRHGGPDRGGRGGRRTGGAPTLMS